MKLSTFIKTAIASTAIYTTVAFGTATLGSPAYAAPMTSLAATAAAFIQGPTQTQTQTQPQAETLSSGTFTGASDHVTKGEVRIVKTSEGYALILDDAFFLDGAPDPVIGFGTDGQYDSDSQFTKLKKKRGAQQYTLPASFTPGQFNQVYVWCEKFSVPLGIADLT